ncbi:hypothetical protein YC2023_081961 [Brassica napus]|uniref:Uncharacterized protein n=3 Tax=Brassica TaxID=3705 RepID=A0A3P6EG77_BRAOL|nr:unnamed protein product [Brassica napus]VDD35581.1 unnamed protein product [Brassica oleracea]
MQCWLCAESVYYSRHANEEIRSCKNLQQMEFTPGRILLLPSILCVHPNTILSRIKKKKQTIMMHRSSWEEKKS